MNELLNILQYMDDPNARYVLTGTFLLGLSAGVLGCFAILRRRALVGDAVAHAVLPGVCLAFIIVGDKDPFALLIGSM
ncbi:MAG: metal ABC transporter permease, partial [Cyclonatronaceae bacterium]